jgi:hypothetical protein
VEPGLSSPESGAAAQPAGTGIVPNSERVLDRVEMMCA